ncbi:MAG: ABC transporter ATP-binding protein [Candidatus Dormibacteria bacterium]
MSDLALSASHVTKRFRIPLDKSATLKHRVVHMRSTSRYRPLLAVDDVSFDVHEGEFMGIIGRNGSGKSTLLKMLARIYRPTTGKVVINGKLSPFLELGVGFNPELTARENVLLNGAILGLARRDLSARMEEMLHFAELDQFADTKLKNFSSGMHVRLAFTVAIQANAAILLMDEVLAVGDARFQAKCLDVFNDYRRQGRTIVLVTHDLSSVELYADRAIMLEHGKVVEDGHAADVTARYHRLIGQLQDDERRESGGSLVDLSDVRPSDSRWGSGDIRVQSVRFLGADGEPHVSFTTGEPMTIQITAEANRDVSDTIVGIGLHRADGSIIGGINTKLANVVVPQLRAGQGAVFRFKLDALRFLTGTYRATIGLHNESGSTVYDWLDQSFEFRVNDDLGRPGQYDLGLDWEVFATQAPRADDAVIGSAQPA